MWYNGGPQGLLVTVGHQFGCWKGRQMIKQCSVLCWFGSVWNDSGTVGCDCCFKKSGKIASNTTKETHQSKQDHFMI